MTTTLIDDMRRALNKGDLNTLADQLRQMKFGNMCSPIKATFTGLTSAAAQDITTAAAKAAGVLVGATLDNGENLPPIGQVIGLRVTAGAAVAGPRVVTDAAGTPAAHATGLGNAPGGVATISDDGKTLTFETTVTAFVLIYLPRTSKVMTDPFPPTT